MILAYEIIAYTSDGKPFYIKPYSEIRNIKPAIDKGVWFDVKIEGVYTSTWKRLWAPKIKTLQD